MIERIKLLNKLNRVGLIKLLNIENMSLEKLLDLYIIVKRELVSKYSNIDRIELREEYYNFYNTKLGDEYNSNSFCGMMDLLKIMDLKNMDFCELLYLNIIIEDAIDAKFLTNYDASFLSENDMFYFNDNNTGGFGKINFINYNNMLYGVDKNYNFYFGKVDENNNCVLFNVLRKGLPDDLSNDVLVFNGKLFNNNLDGIWSIGSRDVCTGIESINNMNNCIHSTDYVFSIKDLYIAYVSCSSYTKTLANLLSRIDNESVVNIKK